jgi:hypothetical protein
VAFKRDVLKLSGMVSSYEKTVSSAVRGRRGLIVGGRSLEGADLDRLFSKGK